MGTPCCGSANTAAESSATPTAENATIGHQQAEDIQGRRNHDHCQEGLDPDHHDHDQNGHDHDHGTLSSEEQCNLEGECCDDDSCCDITTLSQTATIACCDSNEEHCDEKCIIAVAALECERLCETAHQTEGSASHEHDHDKNGQHPAEACTDHLAKAFEQYRDYLESARCICRSILERGWTTTCCAEQPKKAPATVAATANTRATYSPRGEDGTFASGRQLHSHDGPHHHHGIKRRGKKASSTDEGAMCGKDGTCGGHGHDHEHPPRGDGHAHDHGHGNNCCSGHAEHSAILEKEKVLGADNTSEWDLEMGAGIQHVAIAVEGMDCSGCGNKLERTLNAIAGVSSVKVNFVMGRAEFNIDTSVNSLEEVLRSITRATSFQCSQLSSDDQVLDLLATGGSAKALVDLEAAGVTSGVIRNKKTVRLSYDPTIVGARALLAQIQHLTTGLAPPQDDPAISSGRKRLYDQLTKFTASAALTIPVLVMAWSEGLVAEPNRAIASLVLGTLVQLIAVPDFYKPAIGALIHSGAIEMDMLVVISITAAYTYSLVAFVFRMAGRPLEIAEFFETSTLLITLVILGRLVAAFARIRAVEAVSLRSLQSSTATIVENDAAREIDARLLQYGDVLQIGPHSVVPTDATVISGSSEVDESMLTGESVPVYKTEGHAVIAGTVNGSGSLTARLTRLPGKNTVTDITTLVEEAQKSKPKLQDVADRVASWFVPIVSSIAVIVVIVWLAVGVKVRHYGAGKAIANAITYAVSTLAVSCPCALGLAVPMVLVVAGGIAARDGVIIKSAESTERARKVTDVVFDKTGTITEEDLDVADRLYLIDSDEAVALSKALVAGNKHPVSLAVAKHLEQFPIAAATVGSTHVIPGAGVECQTEKSVLRAGNPTWTETAANPVIGELQSQGMTILAITRDSELVAAFGLRTRLRNEASRVVSQLAKRGISTHLVSGDQKRAVQLAASEVGIAEVAYQCTPVEKRDYVARLMAQGKTVLFIGDGTNDAVAVTQADVGVQLGSVLSASDVTRGAADVVLLNGLEGIPFLLDMSKACFHRIAFNFVWSGVYNVLAILLASGAFVKVRIPPAYAGLGEIVSVLPVIVAAMTMLLSRPSVRSAT